MFDVDTARLIRAAPGLRGVDPALLPQELTQVYADLAGIRMRRADLGAEPGYRQRLDRLKRIATIYEAAVDTGTLGEARRGAAFVAGTAHQILARALRNGEATASALLTPTAIHPDIAAPLLFLVAEQNPDAREAARPLVGVHADDLLRTALIETIHDLADEQFEQVLERAERLRAVRSLTDAPLAMRATQALYGLCWSGVVQMVSRLLGRPVPETAFNSFDTPQAAFDQVVELSTEDIVLPGDGGHLVSAYGGPRHLARLLGHVSEVLDGAGVCDLAPPHGANANFWVGWLRHRAQSKPVLWRNHRAAVATGFLAPGCSAVLVLPTGAGKTTLSELKVASALAVGKKVIFLVPTLALVDQLRDDLAISFPARVGGIEVSSDGDLTALIAGPELKSIEMMTPERCLALLSFADTDVSDIGLIVFDECHLLSPEGGGSRSVDAMLCLLHALKRAPAADYLLLSAMLINGEEVASWLADVTGRPCEAFYDPWKPSRQARGVVIYPQVDLVPIDRAARAARRAKAKQQRFRKPPMEVSPHALFGLHNNWAAGVAADTRLVKLSDEPVRIALGAGGASPNANEVAATLAASAAHAGLKVIVFVQQADHAPSTARKLREKVEGTAHLTAVENGIWLSIKAEVGGEENSLIDPTTGALPHNGDMIALERRLAESLFRRPDGINVIIATPTLAQGMNLPAQIAILAGNKRHDDTGRSELKQHEILNAAGRAGRAGHLANGIVLLIPEPVVGFDVQQHPDEEAFEKLRSILPASDQCVQIDDPLTELLDRVQVGEVTQPEVRYLLSRLRAGENEDVAQDAAVTMIQRSFAAYQAKRREAEAEFEGKVVALRAALADEADAADSQTMRVAAFTGMTVEPLSAAMARLERDLAALPASIVTWSDWFIDFFRDDLQSFKALFGRDVDVVQAVVRGVKTGGLPSAAEFEKLKAGMRAWLSGRPLSAIEAALGVAPDRVGVCKRARDLVLKLANRRLYMVAAAVSELAKVRLAEAGAVSANPAVLEVLAVAFRKGFDTPEKVAFAQLSPKIRSRVLVHKAYARRFGAPEPVGGRDYRAVLSSAELRLSFAHPDNEVL